MTTRKLIEKKGFKLTEVLGWNDNGEKDITSVIASKGRFQIAGKNVTEILRKLRNPTTYYN